MQNLLGLLLYEGLHWSVAVLREVGSSSYTTLGHTRRSLGQWVLLNHWRVSCIPQPARSGREKGRNREWERRDKEWEGKGHLHIHAHTHTPTHLHTHTHTHTPCRTNLVSSNIGQRHQGDCDIASCQSELAMKRLEITWRMRGEVRREGREWGRRGE